MGDKDRAIDKANQYISFLKNNKEVVYETKHLFPEFNALEKVKTETKVETIVVEKPVDKLVFVNIEKRIKEFVQPERAVVNRVISCEPSKNCNCNDNEEEVYGYKTELANMQNYASSLEENMNSYKAERGRL